MYYKIADFRDELRQRNHALFAQGCNTKGGFGSGIAGIIAEEVPECRVTYLKHYQDALDCGKPLVPGEVIWHHETGLDGQPPLLIANLLTQDSYGYDGKKYASYDAIDQSFETLAEYVKPRDYINDIAFPLIGCGLGGLQWNVVSEIIDYRLQGLNYVCIVREEDYDKYHIREHELKGLFSEILIDNRELF